MPQQIGWSIEDKLLYDIKKGGGGGGGASLKSFPSLGAFPIPGQNNAIYLALDTNQIYYWDSTTSSYIEISGAPASVVAYPTVAAFPVTGSIGVIYIAEDSNLIYRWNGTAYVEVSSSSPAINLFNYYNFI